MPLLVIQLFNQFPVLIQGTNMQVGFIRHRILLLLLHKVVPGALTFHPVDSRPGKNQRRKRVRLPERMGHDMFQLQIFQLMRAIRCAGERACPIHVHGNAALAYQVGRKRFPRQLPF